MPSPLGREPGGPRFQRGRISRVVRAGRVHPLNA